MHAHIRTHIHICTNQVTVNSLLENASLLIITCLTFITILYTGKEQNWSLSLLQHETSIASFLLMQITFTSHQFCAEKRAIVSHDKEAFNVSSNMTLQEHDKLPLVHNITKTLLNVTNLLRCVRYRHRVRVVYPGLGETEEKIYEDTSMLRKTQPHYTCCFTWVQPNLGVHVSRGKGAILALKYLLICCLYTYIQ